MTYTYVGFLKDVIKNLDEQWAIRQHAISIPKAVGLCYIHGMTAVVVQPEDKVLGRYSEFRVETRQRFKDELEKLRARRNVFYTYNQGKTDDPEQFIWKPYNHKSRRKFLTKLLNEAVEQVNY